MYVASAVFFIAIAIPFIAFARFAARDTKSKA